METGEQLRADLKDDKAAKLKAALTDSDTTQYSAAVMHDRALNALNDNSSDALYDLNPDQIPYISYLRAINQKIPIPATMAFIEAQLSLSRSKDRKGRQEFGSALNNNRPIIYSSQLPTFTQAAQPETTNGGLLSRLTRKKSNGGDENA